MTNHTDSKRTLVAAAEWAVFNSLEHSLRIRDPHSCRHARLIRDLRIDGDDLADLFLRDLERELGIRLSDDEVRRIYTAQDAIDACVRALNDLRHGSGTPEPH